MTASRSLSASPGLGATTGQVAREAAINRSAASSTGRPHRRPSETTARARALVAARRSKAAALGHRIGRLAGQPEAVATALRSGLAGLGDQDYIAGQRRVAPGVGPLHGVRWPLLDVVLRSFREAASGEPADHLLSVADRLLREEHQEPRWLAIGILERVVLSDPERTWQLLRRIARGAGEWITVDTLARATARGILSEPYRWAELEQLIYSPGRWERRLVGSTVATIPFIDVKAGRRPEIATTALRLVGQLIGDADPVVQKALSWAYRSLLRVDAGAVTAALAAETALAARTGDGHRAWVIRDVLPRLDPNAAEPLRERLAGIRRRVASPPTSTAGQTVAAFGRLPDPAAYPEPPLF